MSQLTDVLVQNFELKYGVLWDQQAFFRSNLSKVLVYCVWYCVEVLSYN